MALLRRQWFLFALAAVLLVGFTFPDELASIARFKQLRMVIVAAVLFITSVSLETRQIGESIRQPRAPLLASSINMVFVPAMAILVSKFLTHDWATGLVVAGAAPSTIASAAVWTRRAGGNDVVALMVTVITNSLCFLLTPMWVSLGAGEQSVTLELVPMIQKLAVVALLPMALAQLLRQNQSVAAWTMMNRSRINVLAQLGILVMVLIGAIHCGLKMSSMDLSAVVVSGSAMLVAVVAIHLSALWLGQSTGRAMGLDRGDWIAVGFAGSQKTLTVGLHVALMVGGGLIILPMVAYHVSQLVIDTVVADRLAVASNVAET